MPKFTSKFTSKHNIEYEISSADDYIFSPSDFYCLKDIFSDPAVYEYITKDTLTEYYPKSPFVELLAMDFLRFTALHWEKQEQFDFFIRRTDNKKLVGYIKLETRKNDVPERSMAKISTEPGFMKQALEIVLSFAKEMGYPKTFGLVNVKNERMQQFARSMNMQNLGVIKEGGQDYNRFEIKK